MKKVIYLILIILWMCFIFYMSSFDGSDSTKISQGFLDTTLGKIIDIFDRDISDSDREELIIKLDYPIRKMAHGFEYFVLCILVSLFLSCCNIGLNRILVLSFIICFIYSCSDEIHQLFISNRSGRFSDVLIDSLGCSIWLFIYYFIRRKYENKI